MDDQNLRNSTSWGPLGLLLNVLELLEGTRIDWKSLDSRKNEIFSWLLLLKKESVSLSLFMEGDGLEVEEDLSIMVTLFWAEGVWLGRWRREQKVWRKPIFEVQTWRQGRGPAGAVMCETRDLGIKWPQSHTLLFG